jgi:hypothetical protein
LFLPSDILLNGFIINIQHYGEKNIEKAEKNGHPGLAPAAIAAGAASISLK